MKETLIEAAQPYVTTIVTAIVGLLAALILSTVNQLKAKANEWIDARTNAAQRETIHKIAAEAFSLAQTAFKESDGQKKLKEAMQYASDQLSEKGIPVSALQLQAAIEKAYLEYKASLTAGQNVTINTEGSVKVDDLHNTTSL